MIAKPYQNKKHSLIAVIATVALLFILLSSSILSCSVMSFTVTVSTDGNGSVESSIPLQSVPYGSEITLEAIPDTGWYFDHWEGDIENTGTVDTVTITITKNMEITAVFKESTSYTLSAIWQPQAGTTSLTRVQSSETSAKQVDADTFGDSFGSVSDSNNKTQPGDIRRFSPQPEPQPSFHDIEEIIIRYKENAFNTSGTHRGPVSRALEKTTRYAESVRTLGSGQLRMGVAKYDPASDKSFQEVLNYYNSLNEVEFAEPNYPVQLFETPNDPYWDEYPNSFEGLEQWNLQQLNMPAVWSTFSSSEANSADGFTGWGVVVAVLDTGFRQNVGNPTDYGQTNFVAGYDFINDDNNPYDDNGHGTHVTGTIAETTNNDILVGGMAFGASIMPVKVMSDAGSGSVSTIAEGIDWAQENGAQAINLSLGLAVESETLKTACTAAYNAGITIVAASGNGGNDGIGDSTISYPAAFSTVIAVGATGRDKTRAPYSNYGNSLDVVAPGGNFSKNADGDTYENDNGETVELYFDEGITQQASFYNESTGQMEDGFYSLEGTSMATPHVAALAALLIEKYPNMSVDDRKTAITNTAEDLGAEGWDSEYGYGLINPLVALDLTFDGNTKKTDWKTGYIDPVRNTVTEYTIDVSGGDIYLSASFDGGSGDIDLFLLGPDGNKVASSTLEGDTEEITYENAASGTYTIKLKYTP